MNIKKGQIWRNKKDGRQFKVLSKTKKDKWRMVQLTNRNDYYSSTHTFLPQIILWKFELVE